MISWELAMKATRALMCLLESYSWIDVDNMYFYVMYIVYVIVSFDAFVRLKC